MIIRNTTPLAVAALASTLALGGFVAGVFPRDGGVPAPVAMAEAKEKVAPGEIKPLTLLALMALILATDKAGTDV